MAVRLYLVRHAMPLVEPHVASDAWQLGDAGRAAAVDVARAFGDGQYRWVASTQAKARQTAEAIVSVKDPDAVIHTDTGFVEVAKPQVFVANHRQLASAYVSGTTHVGWESHEDVVARFDAAMARQLRACRVDNLVVVTHGMALTLWLARHIDFGDAGRFWRGLALPDVIAVDPPAFVAPAD